MEHRGRRSPQPVRLKWAAVSAYCRRHGVERGPMQCRKRWGNLSWDLKKIVAWEKNLAAVVSGAGDNAVAAGEGEGEAPPPPRLESFWDMRGEQRRARQLPSSFDREVYDALVGGHGAAPPSDFGEDLADGDGVDADELPPPPLMVMPISGQNTTPTCPFVFFYKKNAYICTLHTTYCTYYLRVYTVVDTFGLHCLVRSEEVRATYCFISTGML
jgi:hypothetical protein